MAKLSVIIPCFQEEKILKATLQHWKSASKAWGIETEIIVSDGGSTDASQSIAEQLADKLVVHNPDLGRQSISEGRNRGADLAEGDYFLFTNADVELPENHPELISELLRLADERGASTSRVQVHPRQRTLLDRLVLGGCDMIFMLMNKAGIGMGRGECHMVKRDLYRSLNGYREDLIAGEDFEFYKRIAKRLRVDGKKIGYVWKVALYEDPRRYRKIGYPRTLWSWFRNTLSVTFRNRSHSTEWSVLR